MALISPRSRPVDIVRTIWAALQLPPDAVSVLELDRIPKPLVPCSYKVTELAQSSIALAALATSLVQSQRTSCAPRAVSVDPLHAVVEFSSEKYNYVNGEGPPPLWGCLSGLYECADGHVRLHDSFANHRAAIQRVFRVKERRELEETMKKWKKEDVERIAGQQAFAAYALRKEQEWELLEQAKMSGPYPIEVIKRTDSPKTVSPAFASASTEDIAKRPLKGLRVLELSRVLAAPVAGRTFAHHGADVFWITSPNLPSLPGSDRDVSRGKRTVQLDLDTIAGQEKLRELVKDADVFIQSYRPGSLEKRGFGAEQLRKLNPGLIYANLSAWGPGPWAQKRGFDSLVQTATGINAAEAEAFGSGAARPLPCQALDHSGGYFLATGILAAVWRRGCEGGGWDVNVSLQGCMQLLKDLGRAEDGVLAPGIDQQSVDQVSVEQMSGFGMMKAVRHAGVLQGCEGGYDFMPKELGTDRPEWL